MLRYCVISLAKIRKIGSITKKNRYFFAWTGKIWKEERGTGPITWPVPPLGFLIAGGYCSFRILSTIMTASVMVIFASPFMSPMSISSMLMGAEPPVIGSGSCR